METLNLLRALELREIELETEMADIIRRRRELLGFDAGARKNSRTGLSKAQGKTLFAALKTEEKKK